MGLSGIPGPIWKSRTQKPLLYPILKILARASFWIYCRKLVMNEPALLRINGPVLLAANHPNSFLDSVILDTLFSKPVWSLARGDAFKKPLYSRLMRAMKIMPVYRTSEGVENLSSNYQTFNDCIALFRNDAIICIFSEGKCINEWHLRPLKKGTARLAIKAWEEGIPLQVIPVGINFSSFSQFGKNIFLQFGKIIRSTDINLQQPDGLRHAAFNTLLEKELQQLVFEIPKDDLKLQQEKLAFPLSLLKKWLLFIPACIGALLHAPLFLPVRSFVNKKTKDTDHYDSVMVAILMLLYPLYLILLTIVIGVWAGWWALLVLIISPITARAFVMLNRQTGS